MGSYLDALFAGLQTVAARGPRTTEGSGRGQRTEDRGQQVASFTKPHTTQINTWNWSQTLQQEDLWVMNEAPKE